MCLCIEPSHSHMPHTQTHSSVLITSNWMFLFAIHLGSLCRFDTHECRQFHLIVQWTNVFLFRQLDSDHATIVRMWLFLSLVQSRHVITSDDQMFFRDEMGREKKLICLIRMTFVFFSFYWIIKDMLIWFVFSRVQTYVVGIKYWFLSPTIIQQQFINSIVQIVS